MSNTYDIKSPEADMDTEVPVMHQGGLKVPKKTWYKDPGLRSLYKWMPILMLGRSPPLRDIQAWLDVRLLLKTERPLAGSSTVGYDGSLLNGLQTMEPWRRCEYCLDLRSPGA